VVQDAINMVIVGNLVTDAPPLRYIPHMLYTWDQFQKPYPFIPDVLIDIDAVYEKKVDVLECHVSQMYHLIFGDPGSADPAARRAWLEEKLEPDMTDATRLYRAQLAAKYGKAIHGFAPDALEALATAAWPGNVRQLYNVVEQSCALTTTPLIPLTLVKRALRVPAMEALSYTEAKQRFERNYLVLLLKLTEGNVADAARIADRNRTEFYRLLQKYDLTPAMFRGDGEPAPE